MKYKIWNGTETLVTPIGEVLTPSQVVQRYPAAGIIGMKYIICDAPISMGVFQEFTQTINHYKMLGVIITEEMTDQEMLDAISYFEENPPAPEPSTEERIAAALEFQAMMQIPVE